MPDRDWSEAFSALPTETPEPLGWERLRARLPTTAPAARPSWPRWLAAAAVLAAIVAIPLMRMRPDVRPASTSQSMATVAAVAPSAITAVSESHEPTAKAADVAPSVATHPSFAARARHVTSTTKPGRASAARPSAEGDDLEPLYRQSARLETLLALARDEQVAGGVSTALSDDLEARIANIDAQLSRPDLQPQQRATLWHQRIGTLQQLAGIAATDRLYTARGQQHDAVLVSID